jgi:antitoxin (DNA-binding transcriptional repressor) of toxin-antitoxin stability system
MCYMMTATHEAQGPRRRRRPNRRVGVREMRQNLSVYLDRVKAGETIHVTEYGQVVALLAPLPAKRLTTLERLAREGRATAPDSSLKHRRPPQPGDPNAPSLQQILDELREERL